MVWGFLETPMSSQIRISEYSVGLRCLLQTQLPLLTHTSHNAFQLCAALNSWFHLSRY